MAQSVARQWPALPDATPESLQLWAKQITRLLQEGAIASPGGNLAVDELTTDTIELGHPSDTTLSRLSAGDMGVEGNRVFRVGGVDVPIADGGTGASSASAAFDNLKQAATATASGVVEHATDAEIRAATAGNFTVTAASIETASAQVSLTDAATVAVDWDTFTYALVILTANRALGVPTNGQPGTYRTIRVAGNDATTRSLTFAGYGGGTATLTDITNTKQYLLTLFATNATTFVVKATQSLP